jgi:hypothetical protein
MSDQNQALGPCVACGLEIVLPPDPLNRSSEGVTSVYDVGRGEYVRRHKSCRDAELNQQAGSPQPPRARRRVTLTEPPTAA